MTTFGLAVLLLFLVTITCWMRVVNIQFSMRLLLWILNVGLEHWIQPLYNFFEHKVLFLHCFCNKAIQHGLQCIVSRCREVSVVRKNRISTPKHQPHTSPLTHNHTTMSSNRRTPDTFNTLVQRVHNLPPELFNIVQDLTFTPDAPVVELNDSYQTPRLLAIDQSSRNLFAQRYYGETIFTWTDLRQIVDWIRKIPPSHRAMIKRLENRVLEPWEQQLDAEIQLALLRIVIRGEWNAQPNDSPQCALVPMGALYYRYKKKDPTAEGGYVVAWESGWRDT